MRFELDNFNGIIIDPSSLPKTMTELENHLNELSAFLNREKKSIAWISLPIARADCVPMFTNAGFTFHSCVKEEVTLVRESASCTFVPFIPTHTIGAGAIVLNHAKEILLVKDRGTDRFKLPGGFVESFESIQDSIRREVFEETGIQSEFDSIVGFTTKHAYRLGKSNLHFICRMRALTETIKILDTVEIEDAKWMPLEAYLSEDGYSLTDRQIVRTIATSSGLVSTDFSGNVEPHRRNEIFVAATKDAR